MNQVRLRSIKSSAKVSWPQTGRLDWNLHLSDTKAQALSMNPGVSFPEKRSGKVPRNTGEKEYLEAVTWMSGKGLL